MYRIWLTNFGYFMDFQTANLDEAIAKAKSAGFEVVIYLESTPTQGARIIASYSPIGGLKTY